MSFGASTLPKWLVRPEAGRAFILYAPTRDEAGRAWEACAIDPGPYVLSECDDVDANVVDERTAPGA